jgi:hypothetical protein
MLQWWLVRLNKKHKKPNDSYPIYQIKDDRIDFWKEIAKVNSTLEVAWQVQQIEVETTLEKLSLFLDDKITWKEFYEWHVPRGWISKEELDAKIDLFAAEYTGEHVTLEQLKENLKSLL